jgi:hypothetical protein
MGIHLTRSGPLPPEQPNSLLKKAFVAFFNRALSRSKAPSGTHNIDLCRYCGITSVRFPRSVSYFNGLLTKNRLKSDRDLQEMTTNGHANQEPVARRCS